MPALLQLVLSENDEAPPAPRSRREWINDSVLFALAVALGAASLASNVKNGLDGPLLYVDAIAGGAACIALWWRRRWPLGIALGTLPLLPVSGSAGAAGLIMLFTVAAHRRWQAAALVAALQLALQPAYYAVHPEDDSVPVYVIAVAFAAIVAWGMFLRGRRDAQREAARRAEAEE
jgi:hypothetical protein